MRGKAIKISRPDDDTHRIEEHELLEHIRTVYGLGENDAARERWEAQRQTTTEEPEPERAWWETVA